MSPAPFDLNSRVLQPRSQGRRDLRRDMGGSHYDLFDGNTIRELLGLLVLLQGSTVTANLCGLDQCAGHEHIFPILAHNILRPNIRGR